MIAGTKARLGDRLFERGLLSREQLEVALAEQRRAHRPLGEILVELGFASQESVLALVAEDLGVRFLRAGDVEPDPHILAVLDPAFVREAQAFPVRIEEGELLTLMVEPDDPVKVAAVRARFPYPLRLAATTERDLQVLVSAHLRRDSTRLKDVFTELARQRTRVEDYPVERLVHALLCDGVYRGATDIHIEPDERVTRLRYRIDGILVAGESLPQGATAAIVSRVKILSGLDISERRRPQDGRLRLVLDERAIDMRVSVMPCVDGENVVVRILDKGQGNVRIDRLGLAAEQQRALRRIAQRSHGLFLVTGPTGSGKTTTLYALLAEVDAMTRNVATVEDPIEYRMPMLRQSQVDPAIGFGFKEGLRSLLRQDPDVILVGEVRDQETADMAIKASMTGHLVFSTLHTNSALGAIPRLVDMGVDAFLIEDSLIGVLAQRLVRRVCAGCAAPVKASDADQRWLDGDVGSLLEGRGCERCNGSGFQGRTVISELFLPDEEIADAIRAGADLGVLRRLAVAAGMRTLGDDGKAKVRLGITTRSEVERVNRSHRFDREEREGL